MSEHIYYISEPSLNINIGRGNEASWNIDDLLTNAACSHASDAEVALIGRVSADITGSIILEALHHKGVNTAGVDVYSDVPVPLMVTGRDLRPALCCMTSAEGFNPVWPRFEENDIVVWGGYFSLDKAVHQRLLDLLKYAAARKATMVYVPYFTELQVPRVTRVMPEIFDNLELAQVVIASTDTMHSLFGTADMAAAFRDHIAFYAKRFYALKEDSKGKFTVDFTTGSPAAGHALPHADAIAHIVNSLSQS